MSDNNIAFFFFLTLFGKYSNWQKIWEPEKTLSVMLSKWTPKLYILSIMAQLEEKVPVRGDCHKGWVYKS